MRSHMLPEAGIVVYILPDSWVTMSCMTFTWYTLSPHDKQTVFSLFGESCYQVCEVCGKAGAEKGARELVECEDCGAFHHPACGAGVKNLPAECQLCSSGKMDIEEILGMRTCPPEELRLLDQVQSCSHAGSTELLDRRAISGGRQAR